MTRSRILTLIAFVFLFAVFITNNLTFADTGSISGTVTSGGQPVQGLTVFAYDYSTEAFAAGTGTQADGSYTLTGLASGNYRVGVESSGGTEYAREYYDNTHYYSSATPVPVTSGQTTSGIDFSIEEGGRIVGVVKRDSDSQPIEGQAVSAYDYSNGKYVYHDNTQSDGSYSIRGLPVGNFRVKAEAWYSLGYAIEYYDDTYDYGSAAPVSVTSGVTTTGINFSLGLGGTITGTIYEASGTTPITGTRVEVEAFIGDSCDGQWITNTWSNSSDGTYTITGLPPEPVEIYLRTDESSGEANYACEWWAGTSSTYMCDDAVATAVTSGSTVYNRDFQLAVGGGLSGVVTNKDGVRQQNVQVEYWNDSTESWKQTFTGSDGSFEFSALQPGPAKLSIKPDVDTGLVWYVREYWLNQGEDKDLGTMKLQNGALISGVINDASGDPLDEMEYYFGGKFEIGWGETGVDGSLEFRLPVGNYALNLDENEYCMVPVRIEVNNVNQDIELSGTTAYDAGNASAVTGTVTDSKPHNGALLILAFPDDYEFASEEWDGVDPMAFGIPDGGTGDFTLFVPPGIDVTIMLGPYSEGADNQESLTLIDKEEGITPPATGTTLAYDTEGQTVDGFAKYRSVGVYKAKAMLLNQAGEAEEFSGFAETDNTGKYIFYNVPPGTYRIGLLYYDCNSLIYSDNFIVNNEDVSVSDINIPIKCKAMPWISLLLLND